MCLTNPFSVDFHTSELYLITHTPDLSNVQICFGVSGNTFAIEQDVSGTTYSSYTKETWNLVLLCVRIKTVYKIIVFYFFVFFTIAKSDGFQRWLYIQVNKKDNNYLTIISVIMSHMMSLILNNILKNIAFEAAR